MSNYPTEDMSQPDQLPALPEPVLEGVDYELWGQNAKWDCYSKGQMQDYALTAIATERARADALQAELDAAKTYATSLANSIHAKHYADVTQWRPLSDVLGLLTQIDNMTVGALRRADALEAALREIVGMYEADDDEHDAFKTARALLEKKT